MSGQKIFPYFHPCVSMKKSSKTALSHISWVLYRSGKESNPKGKEQQLYDTFLWVLRHSRTYLLQKDKYQQHFQISLKKQSGTCSNASA